jgi:hypothetical protein
MISDDILSHRMNPTKNCLQILPKSACFFLPSKHWRFIIGFYGIKTFFVNQPSRSCVSMSFDHPVRRCRGPLLEGGSTSSKVAGTSVGREADHRLIVGCVKPWEIQFANSDMFGPKKWTNWACELCLCDVLMKNIAPFWGAAILFPEV